MVFYGDICPVLRIPNVGLMQQSAVEEKPKPLPVSQVMLSRQLDSVVSVPVSTISPVTEMQQHSMRTVVVESSVAAADAREEEEERLRIARQMEELMNQVPDHFDRGEGGGVEAPSKKKGVLEGFVSKLKW
jgi:hypothetical protein